MMGSSLSAMAASASQFPLSERVNTTKGYELHRNEVAEKIFGTDAGAALLGEVVHHVQVKGKVLHFVLLLVIAVIVLHIGFVILRILLLRLLLTATRTAATTALIVEQTVVSEFKVDNVLCMSLPEKGITEFTINVTSLQLVVDQGLQRAVLSTDSRRKASPTSH